MMIMILKNLVLDKYFYTYDNTGLSSGLNRKRRGLGVGARPRCARSPDSNV